MARTASHGSTKKSRNKDQQKENSRPGHGTQKSSSGTSQKKKVGDPPQNIEPLQSIRDSETLNTDGQMQDDGNDHHDVDEVAILKGKSYSSLQDGLITDLIGVGAK